MQIYSSHPLLISTSITLIKISGSLDYVLKMYFLIKKKIDASKWRFYFFKGGGEALNFFSRLIFSWPTRHE